MSGDDGTEGGALDGRPERGPERQPDPEEAVGRDVAGGELGEEVYVLPTSFAQDRLWFLDQMDPGSPAYNVPVARRLVGPLDVAALERALGEVVRRHETLRTSFGLEDGVPVQLVQPQLSLALPQVDLSADADPEEAALARLRQEAGRAFDLGQAPLLRPLLLRLGREEHVLSLTLHHIITDAWSLGLLLQELFTAYEALREDRAPRLPEVAIQYGDFASWQRDWLTGETLEASLRYFRAKLAGPPPLLLLPTDRARSPMLRHAGAVVPVSLSPRLSDRLRALARDSGVTLFMLLLAIFKVLLSRLSGETDVVVGSPVANRNRAEIEGVLGLFVNTLVLRTELAGDPTFREVLERVRQTTLGALEHESVPFEKLVDELRPESRQGHSPFFRVACGLQPPEGQERRQVGELTLAPLTAYMGAAKFELFASFSDEPAGIQGFLEYSTALFDRSTVQRWCRHLRTLAEAVAEAPETPIADLPLLSAAERHRLVVELQDTRRELPLERSLAELFEERAAAAPEAVALELGGESWTYEELDRQANRIAHRLVRMGVGPDIRVALFLEPSPRWVAAILGVLKAGGAYLPIDDAYPPERIAFLLDDAAAAVLVSEERLQDRLPRHPLPRLYLDREAQSLAGEPQDRLPPRAGGDRLAYVIYTSGSTGVPKGVAVPQRAVVRLVLGADYVRLGPDTRLGQISNVAFDAATFEIWGALLNGGRLVGIPRQVILDPDELGRELASRRVDTVFLTAALFQRAAETRAAELAGVTQLLVGGEAVDPEAARTVLVQGGAGRLRDVYGPTECTTFSLCGPVWEVPEEAATVPLGRPLSNGSARVLDERLQPLPVGVVGELYLGGDGLARGYLDRPGLTAERFVPDPFAGRSGCPGERLYRTGDLARLLPDGRIDFIGRRDHQVKIRGFRVELGEIEAALLAVPGIREAVATATGDAAGERQLVAYYTTGGEEPQLDEIRRRLQRKLPQYMMPSRFLRLPSLPLTASGKVDRRALPAVEAVEVAARSVAASPRTPTERRVAEIWSEVLAIDDFGIHDSFFDLGGHSLRMALVRTRLAESLGMDVPMIELFNHPTLHSLAAWIDQQGAAAPPPRDGSFEGPAPARSQRPAADDEAADDEAADDGAIAVVGLAARFPGARDVDELWRLLCEGRESITFFTDEELLTAGIDRAVLADPTYVKAKGCLEDADLFDAGFFGIGEKEAQLMDPQHRLFLETAWQALEDAGCDAERFAGSIGVFGGASQNDYAYQVYASGALADGLSSFLFSLGNDKDHLTARVSYKLGLEGPSIAVQTGCSTSLVAVHLACQSLRQRDCDLCLAGGVSITARQTMGYFHQEGVLSPDGHCRPFDARGEGTVPSDGVGVVVLKRLADAVADGDAVRAVIRGSGINSDGASKVGYVAPSATSQARLIRDVHRRSGVAADSVTYVETHGTGTRLGDPIEVAALSEAFRSTTARSGFCALGSIKGNLGHTNAAAGVAGMIKTIRALEEGRLPPSLHFETANPEIDFEASPFFVQTRLGDWPAGGRPRRAGVTSLGLGGTNAHLVLEEAPPVEGEVPPARPWQLLVLSARSEEALEASCHHLAAYLRAHREVRLADVAHTLQVGRRVFEHRRIVLCRDAGEAIEQLESPRPERSRKAAEERKKRPLELWFPAAADGFAGAADLYRQEAAFGDEVDRCAELLAGRPGLDPRPLLAGGAEEAGEGAPPSLALVVFELALARLWAAWGVAAQVVRGEGGGEIAAACHAGSLGREEALELAMEGRRPDAGQARGETSGAAPADPTRLRLVLGSRATAGAPSPSAVVALERAGVLGSGVAACLWALGELWLRGVEVDWTAFGGAEGRRLPLPTYPFERRRYWVGAPLSRGQDEGRIEELRAEWTPVLSEPLPAAGPTPAQRVRRIWEEALEISDVGEDDNFFDLGGDSILALSVLAKLREELGIRLRIGEVVEHQTLGSLTRLVVAKVAQGTAAAKPSSRVVLQPGVPQQRPLWVVHPAGGNVACYGPLARRLGRDLPVLGLEAPELTPGGPAYASVEDLAAHHAATLRGSADGAPLRLVGWSAGAILAWEVAHQARRQGGEVEWLGLLDAFAPSDGRAGFDARDVLVWQNRRLRLGLSEEELRRLDPEEGFEKVIAGLVAAGRALPGLDAEASRRLWEVELRGLWALARYQPRSWDGPVTLFRPSEAAPLSEEDRLLPLDPEASEAYWSGLCAGPVEVIAVGGDHFSMMEEPRVEDLARAIRTILERIETDPELSEVSRER